MFFTKIDISNCFWSIEIPAAVRGSFLFQSPLGNLSTRRLPFGWSWSPLLAHSFIKQLLSPLQHLLHTYWQYIDDLLLAHPDPYFLAFCTHYAAFLLTRAGFLLNDKSVFVPVTSITWLGKRIDTTHRAFACNLPGQLARNFDVLFSVLLRPYSPRRLLQLLGMLQWAARPASEVGVLLPALYQLTRRARQPNYFPIQLWQPLLQACIIVIFPASLKAPPPPLTLPPFFVDAAPQPPRFRVGSNHTSRTLTSCLAPPWVISQNQAELYSVFHCIRQAALLSHTHLCIITDSTAAFYALASGRASTSHPVFLRLLRRIWRIVNQFSLKISVALTPSCSNAADAVSRIHQLPLGVVLLRSTRLHALSQPFSHSLVVPRFWQRDMDCFGSLVT